MAKRKPKTKRSPQPTSFRLEENVANLRPYLKPTTPDDDDWAQPLVPEELYLYLAIDLPENIAIVSRELIEESSRSGEEWLDIASKNLVSSTPEDWFADSQHESGLCESVSRDSYDVTRAAYLDQLLPGKADRGWHVAPVGRDNLYFLPATDDSVSRWIYFLGRTAGEEYPKVDYPISQSVYWVYCGQWLRLGPSGWMGDWPLFVLSSGPEDFLVEKYLQLFSLGPYGPKGIEVK